MLHKSFSNQNRFHLEVELAPQQGSLVAPSNCPNTGPVIYRQKDVDNLLMDGCSKIANKLEDTCLDASGQNLIEPLQGISYVEIRNKEDGSYKQNTMTTAHRLGEGFVKDAVMEKGEVFGDHFNKLCEVKKGAMLNRLALHFALLQYDAGCLHHGAALVLYNSQMRISRLLSGFIEAEDAELVCVGGVKVNEEDKKGEDKGKDNKGGTGNVLYTKELARAKRIVAFFSFDLYQLRSYQFPDEVNEMLFVWALWKVRKFLDVGLRLRSDCDLRTVGELQCTSTDFQVPSLEELERLLPGLIAQCKPYMAGRTVVYYTTPVRQPKKKGETDESTGRDEAENQDNAEGEGNDEEG